MSFEERLSDTLDRVLNEKSRFNAEWGEKRRSIVEPLLQKAETQFKQKLRGAALRPLNGTITLYAGHLGKDNCLRFSPNEERLEVQWSVATYPKDSEEPEPSNPQFLAVNEISEETIEKIILDFAALVARGGRKVGG